jgi:UPF0755 protein
MLGVRIPPGAPRGGRRGSRPGRKSALKKPRSKKFRILGVLSFLLLLALIAATLVFLLHPQKWSFTRNLLRTFVGPEIRVVTIPEGWNRFQVAARLQAAGVVRAEDFLVVTEEPTLLGSLGIGASTAEGYLFPDTYQFYAGGSTLTIVRTMVENFRKNFKALAKKHPGWRSHYKEISSDEERAALIIASIVEEEVAKKSEAPVVAGIFLKRLVDPSFEPHLLQADPTVSYGCLAQDPAPPSCAEFDGVLQRKHLKDIDNMYNTYVYAGLPPGPITNPGKNALKAALDPKDTTYFYFVARGDGTHQFSATLEEHNAAVEKYRDKK